MRVSASASLALLLVCGATACTSGQEDSAEQSTAPAPAPTDEASSATQGDGWLCQDISPSSLRTLAGGQLTDPVEVMVADDDESWICEARDGDTPLMRLSVSVGEQARQEARDRARAMDDTVEGPAYLGESYLSPSLVTALTVCTDMDQPEAGVYKPYSLVAESLVDTEDDLSEPLRSTLGTLAQRLDQGFGCSPKQARSAAQDTATTTAP